jgi:hypothetical protein
VLTVAAWVFIVGSQDWMDSDLARGCRLFKSLGWTQV